MFICKSAHKNVDLQKGRKDSMSPKCQSKSLERQHEVDNLQDGQLAANLASLKKLRETTQTKRDKHECSFLSWKTDTCIQLIVKTITIKKKSEGGHIWLTGNVTIDCYGSPKVPILQLIMTTIQQKHG